jgi:hypothetical protein
MPRVENYELETALAQVWENVNSSGARTTDAYNQVLAEFLIEAKIVNARLHVATQKWTIEEAKGTIGGAEELVTHYQDTVDRLHAQKDKVIQDG